MTRQHATDVRNSEPIIPADGRLITIDILRGLAILWVIIIHLWQPVTLEFGARRLYYERFADEVRAGHLLSGLTAFFEVVFRQGDHGVTMFMILSGLSLTMTTLRRGGVRWRDYYGARLRKLLLPYWAGWALFIATLAALALYRTQIDGGSFQRNFQYLGRIRQMNLEIAIQGLLIVPRGLTFENAIQSRPPALWFVLLLVQYYLIFPLLLPLLRRMRPFAFAALTLAVTIGSCLWMIWAYGDIDRAHGYIWSDWLPFRLFEFGIGMSMGYALIHHPGQLRRWLSRPVVILAVVAAGVASHTAGSWLGFDDGYWNAAAYPLIVIGLSAVMMAVICARPGFVLTSPPARLIAWVGTMSYAALITNESFRILDNYFILKGWLYTPGWWYFIVALYVPLTVILAYPLAVVLGLMPKSRPAAPTVPASTSIL